MNAGKTARRRANTDRQTKARRLRQGNARFSNLMAPTRDPIGISKSGAMMRRKFKVEQANREISSSSTADQVGSWNFQLTHIANAASELALLFDQYRINKVTVVLSRVSNNPDGGTVNYAPLATAIDYDDDDTTGLTYPDILTKQTCMIHPGDDSQTRIVRSFKPRYNTVNLSSTGSLQASGISAPDLWLDMVYRNVPHYGFKYVMKTSQTTTKVAYYVYFIYDVSFAQTR